MISLKQFVNKISGECEEECYVDRQMEEMGSLIILLESHRNRRLFFDHDAIYLTKNSDGFWIFELDSLKDALNLPFETTPRFLVEMALDETPIVDDMKIENKEK